METVEERLEITLKQPNALFEKWLTRWLEEAERRHSKSAFKLREALQSLRSYPLPLATGRECAILRGFGTTLCQLIDKELSCMKAAKLPNEESITQTMPAFQKDIQEVVEIVKKGRQRTVAANKPPKLTKKQQQALAEEDERQREVTMTAGRFRVVLLVDTQETSGKNKRTLDQTRSYLESLALEYEVRRLTVGDFLWIARDGSGNELVLPYICERKRMDDLANSIRDGRFHEQKHRLMQSGIQQVIYLVEDYGNNEHVGLPLDNLYQAMANTQIQSKFHIVRSANHWRSMVHLKGITRALIHLFKDKMLISNPKEKLLPFRPEDYVICLMKFRALYEDSAKNAQLTVREVFVQQLLQLHSLSLEKAMAIVEEYPTPRLLLDAYEACSNEQIARKLLSQIGAGSGALKRPIGDKISQHLYEFYRTEF